MSERIPYPSAARTATPAAVVMDLVCTNAVILVIDVTAIGPAPSVVPLIEGVDVATGRTWPLLAGAALTAITGATPRVLKVAPGITAAANLSAADVVPERIRISMTHSNADSMTYAVTAHLIP